MAPLDFLFLGETKELDDRTRATLPGDFVPLSDGATHYELDGPRDGPPVVLVHGFSVPYFIWDTSFAALAASGFRVLRYDLYGRGYSDRPRLANNRALFARQFVELLDALKLEQVDVVALSMGGVVAADLAARHPQCLRKLVFVDPAGFDLGLPWPVKLLNIPLVGEFLLGVLGRLGQSTLLDSIAADFFDPPEGLWESYKRDYLAAMQFKGFKPSILSTLREGMLEEDLHLYRGLAASGLPTQLFWGEHDKTVPYRHAKRFCELVPGTEFHSIPAAGHVPHIERPEIVHPLMIEFLRR